jgi:Gamma tubulin complex component C-terminal
LVSNLFSRERLRRHFDERNKDPEQRLEQTKAEIQALKDELDGTEVLEDPCTDIPPPPAEEAPPELQEPKTEEKADDNCIFESVDDENKNHTSPIEAGTTDEPDANANVSPRKIPSQLSLTPVDNSAALAAARNRARVLGHELNLIQNLDECDSAPQKNLDSPLDNEQLFETVRMRSVEAARNKARVMQHELFSQDCPALAHPVPDTPDSPEVSAMSISTDESPMEPPPKPFPVSSSSQSMTSLMSLLSEPRKWVSESSRESVNTLIKENGPDTHSKSGFLRLTASIVIRTQLRLANSSVLHVFLSELSVLGHLASLRRFFLLMDGEFAARLTADLCTEAERCRDAPETLLNFATLQMLLQAALSRSEDPNRNRLSLGVRSVPQRLDPSDGRFLECVQLQYETAWPLNCVLTARVLSDYERLFTFLLNLRRTVWTLERCFRLLQTGVGRRLLARSPQHRTLSLHLFEMAAFFRAFHAYVHNVAIVQQWPKCEAALQSVSSLDELRQLHSRLFLKNVVFRCLLRPEAAQIQQLLSGAIRPVLRFHALLSSHPWNLQVRIGSFQSLFKFSIRH